MCEPLRAEETPAPTPAGSQGHNPEGGLDPLYLCLAEPDETERQSFHTTPRQSRVSAEPLSAHQDSEDPGKSTAMGLKQINKDLAIWPCSYKQRTTGPFGDNEPQ